MISIHRFIYNGYSTEDFDLICDLAFNSDDGESNSYLSRDAVMSETYRGDIQRTHSYKYTETLAPTITLIDKNFGDFDLDRQRRIIKWLTSKDTPSFISIYHDDSEVVSYEILGAFTEINTYKLGNGRVVGFQCTFSSVSPFAFSPLHTITKDVSNPTDNTITINLETDDSMPVYPRITIQQDLNSVVVEKNSPMTDNDVWISGTIYHCSDVNTYYWVGQKDDEKGDVNNDGKIDSDDALLALQYAVGKIALNDEQKKRADMNDDGNVNTDDALEILQNQRTYSKFQKYASNTNTSGIETTSVVIENHYNNQVFQSIIKNNIKGETVVLDGANKIISSSRANGRVFGDDFVNWQWIPLYEGKNELSFTGNCTVTVEYREVRKIGEF